MKTDGRGRGVKAASLDMEPAGSSRRAAEGSSVRASCVAREERGRGGEAERKRTESG